MVTTYPMHSQTASLPTEPEHRFELQLQTEVSTQWSCPACSRTLAFDRRTKRFTILNPGEARENHGAVSAALDVRMQMGTVEVPEPPRNVH